MKTLIATLILSSLSLNAMANDNPRPELDSAKLAQEMLAQQQQASREVVLDAIHNLQPLALDTLVVEVSPAVATHPES
ncbi:hypothetical protein D3C76_712110 [compost metagenome]|jgi:hypothetical protein|uniref:DUF2066 domain-containing protein n=1 Tax=Aeromonas media TaxID=651 RepID=A0AAP6G925_AERME|nr:MULTISPECIES: hypothetical protein [Aeromonas]MCK2086031.1 hypothetical protein [Aeromonas genomosp. paramedia]MDX7921035.1 hypothetical protein [Aeromonas media]